MLTALQQKDKQYNWHPYTQHKTASPEIVITRAKDALVYDENANAYIDAISSWWANPFGHCNTTISNAIYKQTQELEHVLFGGFSHTKAIELSEKLTELLPYMHKVFYSDNGSTAIEVALKMVLQFHANKSISKHKIIAFEGAFHGDTFGAMNVSGISLFHSQFHLPLDVIRIPLPNEDNINEIQKVFEDNLVVAFIFEPLVLGALGMKMYEAKYLDVLLKKANENRIITIADEVMTGFGRTGKNFACDYLEQKPNIMCLSKALTAGFLPMAVTLCQDFIYDAFYDDDLNKALFHGHTFTANPIGCAAALASIKLLESEETTFNLLRIENLHKTFLAEMSTHDKVQNVRQLGIILAFEVKQNIDNSYYGNLRNRLYKYFIEHNIILRPVGNTIYILPMFCIEDEQLKQVYKVVKNSLENVF